MNEYLFLISSNPNEKATWTNEKQREFAKKYEKYIDRLMSNSQLISAQPLSAQGAVISAQNEETTKLSSGSDQETITGYYLITTTDLEKAIQLAKQHPELGYCKQSKIEVRELRTKETINGFVYPKAYSLNQSELKSPVLKKSIEINKSAREVWSALTDSEKIKQYFFGTVCTSDWKKGSAISYKGIWQGKPYEDKGNILDIQEGKFIYYNYWSCFSGLEDKPENYRNIRYELDDKGGKTLFTITQDGFVDQKTYEHSDENWAVVMKGLKEMVEKG